MASTPFEETTLEPARAATLPDRPYTLTAKLAAEAFGAFVLVFGGLGIALFAGGGNTTSIPVGLGLGLAMMVAVIAVGRVSGGHFNPAITLGSAIAGRTKWKLVLPYIVVQVVGAALAAVVLFLVLKSYPQISSVDKVFSSLANGFDDHSPSKFPLSGALLVEVVTTAVFVGVLLASTSARANKALAPVGVGLTFAVLVQVALPITNASLNPARSTAVVFFAEGFAAQQLWLFWVAPLLGGAIAGLVARFFTAEPVSDSRHAAAEEAEEPAAAEDVPAAADVPPAAAGAGAAVPEQQEPAARDDREARDFFDNPKA